MLRMVELGRTGLQVSEVGFGGIPIQRLGHDEAVALVRGCLDLGVTLLDTAHAYTTSEARIGAAIAGRREGLVLASKTPAQTGAEARAHLDESLRRLGVDYIDLYQLHNVSSEARWQQVTAPGGPLDALREAQRRGRIGHIGISSHQVDVAKRAVRSGHFVTVMFPLNFVAPEPGEELLEVCRAEGVAFLAMKPMGGGMLEDADLAFRYLRQLDGVIPVVGIERLEEMAEIVGLYALPASLSTSEREEMARLRQALGTAFCRRCEYCQPCPAGIPISLLMNLPAALKRLPAAHVYGPNGLRRSVDKVADCQDCGDCESRCPYHLPIRERLQEIVAIYEENEQAYKSSL
jgi:predicted aldo/keto reductase-like oxidoreductase